MSRRRSCATQNANGSHEDMPMVEFLAGRATVHSDAPDETDYGRASVTEGGRSMTSWLVWDWSRATDERLEGISADVYDLADRVHYLNITVMVAFLVIVLALSALVAAIAL